jgi:hypothetical protein
MEVKQTVKLEIECTAQELLHIQRIVSCYSVADIDKRINVLGDAFGGKLEATSWARTFAKFQAALLTGPTETVWKSVKKGINE